MSRRGNNAMSDVSFEIYEKRILDLKAEIARLREAIVLAENRLEAAHSEAAHSGNDDVCRACVDVAQSYLQAALANEEGK
jgi:Protein of unknown function (DUF1192)